MALYIDYMEAGVRVPARMEGLEIPLCNGLKYLGEEFKVLHGKCRGKVE